MRANSGGIQEAARSLGQRDTSLTSPDPPKSGNRSQLRTIDFIGRSTAALGLRELALTIAPKAATVVLSGETGTGKEVLARLIHAHSARSGRPFVPINCAAIPEALVESEFFGHERGAFTGASATRPGYVEQAHTGTLFLDEFTEIQPHVQAKLLRVLQEWEVRRVGGIRSQQVDVRVIAASSRNLEAALDDGSLRPDLYYRLSVVELHIPALRERREDVFPLSEFFLHKYAAPNASGLRSIGQDALALLSRYGWPGNVRELENVISRATVLAPREDGSVLLPRHLPPRLRAEAPLRSAPAPGIARTASAHDEQALDLRSALSSVKREYAEQALRRTKGNKAEAARLLGISRRGLYNFLASEPGDGNTAS